jgi:hypothetical protein
MNTTKIIIIAGALLIVGLFLWMWMQGEEEIATPTDEVELSDDGMEDELLDSKIFVTAPEEGATIAHDAPLSVSGDARGYWFFEATAPVSVLDSTGLVIGQGYITAVGDWMTEDFVPFSGTVSFDIQPTPGEAGQIVFERANPSGMPENAEVFVVDVVFN